MSLRPSLAVNPRPRCLSTPTDSFQLHPDVRSYGTTLSATATTRSGCDALLRSGAIETIVASSLKDADAAARDAAAGVIASATRTRPGAEAALNAADGAVVPALRDMILGADSGAFSLHWSPYDPVRVVNAVS